MNTPVEKWLGKPCNDPSCSGRHTHTKKHNTWWTVCTECNVFFFAYEPMPHQLRFHRDPAKFKLFGGGFGSSKTTTVGAEFVQLALNTPNGVGLVGASTYPQLERTSKKQVMDMLPEEFIENMDKKNNVMTLTNGYEIMFRSFDDEQKLRSLNLCHVIMEEANGTQFSIFTQLQTRLRHHATKDHKILISTNPDANWVRTEILMKSARIFGAEERYVRNIADINPNISTHIAKTSLNTYLPPNYEADIAVGKPDWWIAKFLKGSFNFSEGAVYPNFQKNVLGPDEMTPEEIRHNVRKKGWKVFGGADFGLKDPTVLLLIAIDPVEGIAYAYDEYYKNQLAVPTHAKAMIDRLNHIPIGGLQVLIGDPSGAKRNINDRQSIFKHYSEYGLFFEPGDNRIDAGILKVYSYLEMGNLKILSNCVHTIEEMTKYHYKPTDLNEISSNKPADGEDHTCDTMRYIIQRLPDDPDSLRTQTYGYDDFRVTSSDAHLPFELQDNPMDNYMNGNSWLNY